TVEWWRAAAYVARSGSPRAAAGPRARRTNDGRRPRRTPGHSRTHYLRARPRMRSLSHDPRTQRSRASRFSPRHHAPRSCARPRHPRRTRGNARDDCPIIRSRESGGPRSPVGLRGDTRQSPTASLCGNVHARTNSPDLELSRWRRAFHGVASNTGVTRRALPRTHQRSAKRRVVVRAWWAQTRAEVSMTVRRGETLLLTIRIPV